MRRRTLLCAVLAALTAPAQAGRAATLHAPAFSLPLIGGGTIESARFTGRPAILLFWAPW